MRAGARLDGTIDYSLVTYPERLEEQRRALFPVLTAEEEAARAKRDGRAPRLVRCRCGRTVRVGRPCWWCSVIRGR